MSETEGGEEGMMEREVEQYTGGRQAETSSEWAEVALHTAIMLSHIGNSLFPGQKTEEKH